MTKQEYIDGLMKQYQQGDEWKIACEYLTHVLARRDPKFMKEWFNGLWDEFRALKDIEFYVPEFLRERNLVTLEEEHDDDHDIMVKIINELADKKYNHET